MTTTERSGARVRERAPRATGMTVLASSPSPPGIESLCTHTERARPGVGWRSGQESDLGGEGRARPRSPMGSPQARAKGSIISSLEFPSVDTP